MEVDDKMMLCSLLYGTLIPINHPLILTVHEINLGAGNAPFFVCIEYLIKVAFNAYPRKPEYNSYALLFTVSYTFMKVEIGICLKWLKCIFGPAFVHDNILDAIFGCKIYVVLVSLCVTTRFEVNIGTIYGLVIPPVP